MAGRTIGRHMQAEAVFKIQKSQLLSSRVEELTVLAASKLQV